MNKNSNSVVKIIAIVVLLFGLLIGLTGCGSSSSTSKWDSLTKEEKQWYKRNYGGGKSQEINKAIKDYKSSH